MTRKIQKLTPWEVKVNKSLSSQNKSLKRKEVQAPHHLLRPIVCLVHAVKALVLITVEDIKDGTEVVRIPTQKKNTNQNIRVTEVVKDLDVGLGLAHLAEIRIGAEDLDVGLGLAHLAEIRIGADC